MKKVINGKMYDTTTAEAVGEYNNGLSTTDFHRYDETLYRKKTGEFFLYGRGGGLSRYGEWHGNSGGPGAKIMPLSLAEAKQWAEEHLSGDEYEAIFGNPEPEDGKESLNLYISKQTKAILQRMSEEQGKSLSKIVEELVGKFTV